MNVSKLIRMWGFVLMMGVFFTACDEGLFPNVTPNDNTEEQEETFFSLVNDTETENDSTDEFGCVSIVYPIGITYTDGTTATANSDLELEQLIDAWFTNNPNSMDFPTINYPIQVIDEDGMTITVNDEEELCELFFACFEDWDDEEWDELCFDINYPITITLPNGNTVTVNSDDELDTAIDNYYNANPNDSNDIVINYPITVTQDDSIITINNDNELEELLDDCFDDYFEECFELVYPIDVMMPDSTIVQAADEDALEVIFDNFFNTTTNFDDCPHLVFPISVQYFDDGSIVQVNSENELEALYEDCYEEQCDNEGMIVRSDGKRVEATSRIMLNRIGEK